MHRRPLRVCALFAALLAPTALAAQDGAVNAKSRVDRILRKLIGTPSVAVKQTLQRSSAGMRITIGGANQKIPPEITKYTRVGDVEVWQKNGMKLARKGARWANPNGRRDWSVSRHPQNAMWRSAKLPDPFFLAERLLVDGGKLVWKLEQTGELDSRPVRKYTCSIGKGEGVAFARAGALPGDNAGNPFVQLLAIRGAAGMRMAQGPESKARYELELHEDPRKRLPARLVVRMCSKNNANARNVVFVAGAGAAKVQNDDEDEKDEKDDDKEKPSVAITLDFSDWGSAEIDDLLPENAMEALNPPSVLEEIRAAAEKAAAKKAAKKAAESAGSDKGKR